VETLFEVVRLGSDVVLKTTAVQQTVHDIEFCSRADDDAELLSPELTVAYVTLIIDRSLFACGNPLNVIVNRVS